MSRLERKLLHDLSTEVERELRLQRYGSDKPEYEAPPLGADTDVVAIALPVAIVKRLRRQQEIAQKVAENQVRVGVPTDATMDPGVTDVEIAGINAQGIETVTSIRMRLPPDVRAEDIVHFAQAVNGAAGQAADSFNAQHQAKLKGLKQSLLGPDGKPVS